MADAERLAQAFHEAYERLAPSFGYETRKASAKPWSEVPENNRALMTAVCAEMLDRLRSSPVSAADGALREAARDFIDRHDNGDYQYVEQAVTALRAALSRVQ